MFFPHPFLFLVVDLGDGSFAATALHQLVDGAFAVTLELVQVLVEDLTRTQRRDEVVKLPADFFRGSTLLSTTFSFPLLLQL